MTKIKAVANSTDNPSQTEYRLADLGNLSVQVTITGEDAARAMWTLLYGPMYRPVMSDALRRKLRVVYGGQT